MLVISRKLGDKIHIGDDITITVVDSSGGRIRLGVEAPRNVPVWRSELGPPPPREVQATTRQDAVPPGRETP